MFMSVDSMCSIIDREAELDLLQIFMILRILCEKYGMGKSYLVGGCVRDLLTAKRPKDFDIVTPVPIDEVAYAFKTAGWRVEETGKVFLVLSIERNGRQYEIANFRKDGTYSDGRRPENVEIGTIEDDAVRRDFTVNALYLEPHSLTDTIGNLYNNVVDPTHRGLKDLRSGILRFVGKPKNRIREDYLRVIRFYRFLTKGFQPDPKSLRACRELFNEAYPKITPERVRAELEKMI